MEILKIALGPVCEWKKLRNFCIYVFLNMKIMTKGINI